MKDHEVRIIAVREALDEASVFADAIEGAGRILTMEENEQQASSIGVLVELTAQKLSASLEEARHQLGQVGRGGDNDD